MPILIDFINYKNIHTWLIILYFSNLLSYSIDINKAAWQLVDRYQRLTVFLSLNI